WVAHHLVHGFDKIILYYNDCDDGSGELLGEISKYYPNVIVRENIVPADKAPQFWAAHNFASSGLIVENDWMLWLDMDEFLVLGRFGPDVRTWLRRWGRRVAQREQQPMDGICLQWRIMGDGGQRGLPDRQISDQTIGCARKQMSMGRVIKTFFRFVPNTYELSIHRPLFRGTGDFPLFVAPNLRRLDDTFWTSSLPGNRTICRMRPHENAYAIGRINHYAVRTPELFTLKSRRPLGSTTSTNTRQQRARLNGQYYQIFNANEIVDRSILDTEEARAAKISEMLSIPAIRDAHQSCRVSTQAKIDALTPEDVSEALTLPGPRSGSLS
ncbi:MAG: glycosyltransferase family 2 protein, partial [Pseudomonadota bacterium]